MTTTNVGFRKTYDRISKMTYEELLNLYDQLKPVEGKASIPVPMTGCPDDFFSIYTKLGLCRREIEKMHREIPDPLVRMAETPEEAIRCQEDRLAFLKVELEKLVSRKDNLRQKVRILIKKQIIGESVIPW